MQTLTTIVLATFLCASPTVAQMKPMPRFAEGATAKLIVPLGDTLHVNRIGVTVFDNKHAEYDVSAWKLGEKLEISLAKILNEPGILKVEPMGDAQARTALDAANNYSNVPIFQLSKLRGAVKEYGARSNADVLVVVNGFSPAHEPFFNSGPSLYKYGIAESGADDSRTAIVYAMLTVLFFDARTGKLLAYSYKEAQAHHAPLPKDLAQSPDDLESAHHDIVTLIEGAVRMTVRQMIELRPEPRG